MQVLRRGSRGEDVARWQHFLLGQDFDEVFHRVEADGIFGEITEKATKAFQQHYGMKPDGIVGNRTVGKAMEYGFQLLDDPADDEAGPNWPPRPKDLQPLVSNDERMQLFGRFQFVPDPDNPAAIKITDNWESSNIVKVNLPQLVGISNAPQGGVARFHNKVADRVVALFNAWQEAGLMGRVLTWQGSYVPRYVRGSRTNLSNHSFGSAFDINFKWNRLGIQPALKGAEGSVRELVSLANQHSFYWGGHYASRLDGMHFEFAKKV
jgi:D-alanyl-D-alanine carboxypeptidase/Putative peptidoglycan binding domain